MSKAKVSVHAKHRITERFDVHKKQESVRLFKSALKNGKSPADFNGPIKDYLLSKQKGGNNVKVYDNKVFIYSHGKKTLITSYELPDKYKGLVSKWKAEDVIKEEIKSMKNKKLKEAFISEFDLFISLMQLSKSVGLLEDKETVEELGEKWFRLHTMVRLIKKRVQTVGDIVGDVKLNEDNCVDLSKQTLEEFKQVIGSVKGFRDESLQVNHPNKKITVIIMNIIIELEYFKNKKFFVSDSVNKE